MIIKNIIAIVLAAAVAITAAKKSDKVECQTICHGQLQLFNFNRTSDVQVLNVNATKSGEKVGIFGRTPLEVAYKRCSKGDTLLTHLALKDNKDLCVKHMDMDVGIGEVLSRQLKIGECSKEREDDETNGTYQLVYGEAMKGQNATLVASSFNGTRMLYPKVMAGLDKNHEPIVAVTGTDTFILLQIGNVKE